jgi:hypothetical protein
LGRYSQDYKGEAETMKLIKNLYLNFYNRFPLSEELKFWATNLEWNNMSYYDVVNNIINNSENFERNLQKEEYIRILYRGVLNWQASNEELRHWVDVLIGGASYKDILVIFLNTDEFKVISEDYYKKVKIKESDLDLIRRDVGEKYGKQLYPFAGFWLRFQRSRFFYRKLKA